MIGFLLALGVLILVLWAISQLLPLAHLPAPLHTVVYVLVVVVAVLWFYHQLGYGRALDLR